MTSEKTRTAIIVAVAVAVVGSLTFAGLKIRAHMVEHRQWEELKQENPVEYHILHTAYTQKGGALRNQMLGTWQMKGLMNRQTGDFIYLPDRSGAFKTWTETNWSIATYDQFSNVQSTASGHYTLEGDNYSEHIEAATGMMRLYLGSHPKFKIRVDGDTYYQMSANPPKNSRALEEMWQRVGS